MTDGATGGPGALGLTATRAGSGGWDLRLLPGVPDLAETPARRVAVLGQVRERGGGALTAERLARSGLIDADGIRGDRLTGCGLVVSMETARPVIHAYRTLLGLPQLYVHAADRALHLSTSLRGLVDRAGPFEPDPAAAADHFTLRFVLPPRTYYRGVSKLPGGHLLTWEDGRVRHRRVTRLEPAREPVTEITPASLAWLDGEMVRVVGAHAAAARAAGRRPATLLSGGVDSVLLQLWLEEAAAGPAPGAASAPGAGSRASRSCAFAVPDAPSFAAETERAARAAERLGTEHLVTTVAAADYAPLLDRTVATLARPSLFNEAWPCHLALAEAVRDRWGRDVVLFGGNAADGLHGAPELAAIAGGAPSVSDTPLGPEGDPLRGPTSLVALAGELPLLLEAFGEAAIRDVFDRRRALALDAAPTGHPWERVQMVDLIATGGEPSTAVADLHGALGLEVAMVYRDDDVAAAVASFHPSIRFLADTGDGRPRPKPLQAGMLARRGHRELAAVPKGGTTFWQDLWQWLGDGPLRDRVRAIERPSFLPEPLFRRVLDQPSDLLWNLLVWDRWRATERG